MIDPKRSELLDIIRQISIVYPDFRLGQLICNLTERGRGPEFGDVWEIEDEQLIPVAQDLLAALEAHAAQTSPAG